MSERQVSAELVLLLNGRCLTLEVSWLHSFSLVGTPLLFVPEPIFAIVLDFVLAINTTGSVGDLFVIWRLRQLPEGTLVYDTDLRHWWVFESLGSGRVST